MFLKEDQNKQELNIFLGKTLCAMTYPPDKKLYVTSNEKVKYTMEKQCQIQIMKKQIHAFAST